MKAIFARAREWRFNRAAPMWTAVTLLVVGLAMAVFTSASVMPNFAERKPSTLAEAVDITPDAPAGGADCCPKLPPLLFCGGGLKPDVEGGGEKPPPDGCWARRYWRRKAARSSRPPRWRFAIA